MIEDKKTIEIFSEDLCQVDGIGKKRAQLLYKKGIKTVWDLLCTVPVRLEDRRKISEANELEDGKYALVAGKIFSSQAARTLRGTRIFTASLKSGNTEIQLVFFNGNFRSLSWLLKPGKYLIAYGIVEKGFRIQMIHPKFKIVRKVDIENYHGKIYPVYSESIRFLSNIMPKLIGEIEERLPSGFDIFPDRFIKKHRLINIIDAWKMMHTPVDNNLDLAKRRMKYNEAIAFLSKRLRFSESIKKARAFKMKAPGIIDKLEQKLPFKLTADQKKAIAEISKSMNSDKAMFHLLQGDVGSGKTVVAIAAALIAADSGYQTAFMAPTDLLAQQHFTSVNSIASSFSLKAVLLTGKQKPKEQGEARNQISSGQADIVVGTHSLISEKTEFAKLGLAIIDEQQRFGVIQRQMLVNKSVCPHLLMLTATPIPRTLLMSFYRELSVSELKQMPSGRKPVKTRVVLPENREKMYRFIEKHIEKGELCYVVLPLIEESEKLNLRNVKKEYERLKRIFSCKIEMLHGQMDEADRQEVMERFRRKETKIVVSTTVIEVGVDVPDATIMLIEDADRFGMSQIHQLRGRVGRSSLQSYCFLAAGDPTERALQRLRFLESCNDGFKISVEDLRLRGPGQFIGENQSGFAGFRYLDWEKDIKIINSLNEDINMIAANPLVFELLR